MFDMETEFVRKTETVRKNRRSSFFQRRISLRTGDINCHSDSSQIEFNESSDHGEEMKLTNYLNKLKKEREDWKGLLKKTKKENYELKERCSQVVDNSSNWEFLTTEDIEFLGDRPDYVSMGRLLDRAVEAVAVRQWLVAASRRKLSSLASDQGNALTSAYAAVIDSTMNCFNELHLITQ